MKRGPTAKPKLHRGHKQSGVGDDNRKYQGSQSAGEPFSKSELKEFVIMPLAAVKTYSEFLQLARWCSESTQLLKALYAACRYQEHIDYLEDEYGLPYY